MADAEVQDPLASIVEKLAVGTVYDHIVEDDYGYQVVRLLEKTGSKYTIESISAKKRLFDDWFREEAGKIKITIHDPAMKKKVLKKYSNLDDCSQQLRVSATPARFLAEISGINDLLPQLLERSCNPKCTI